MSWTALVDLMTPYVGREQAKVYASRLILEVKPRWLPSRAEPVAAKFDPHQPRIPGGRHGGGQWGAVGGAVKKALDGGPVDAQPAAPKPWAATEAGRFHQDLTGVQHLVDTLDSGEVSHHRLGGGQIAEVERVEHANGTTTVHKILTDVTGVMGADLGDPERQADAEQLAAHLGQILGAPVPAVLRTDVDEIWQDHADGPTVDSILEQQRKTLVKIPLWQAEQAALYREMRSSEEGFRLGLFDLLIGNWDRNNHKNTVYTANYTPIGLDHSFAWDLGDMEPDAANPPQADHAISPFALPFVQMSADGRRSLGWKNSSLTDEDVNWLRDRLAEAKPAFEAARRLPWWQFSADRLEAIAPHATGTESRLAP